MTRLAAALFAAALGACSGGGGNAQANAPVNAGAGGNAQASVAAPAAPAPALGPLTAQEICDRLSTATVAEILGFDPPAVIRATASGSTTPQCTYAYPHGPGDFTITVAYMRPDADLAGNRGAAGFDYVVRINRSMAPDAHEQPVQAGQRALRLSGSNLHLGIVLTSGRVLTVIALPSLPGPTVDRLIQATGEAFAR